MTLLFPLLIAAAGLAAIVTGWLRGLPLLLLLRRRRWLLRLLLLIGSDRRLPGLLLGLWPPCITICVRPWPGKCDEVWHQQQCVGNPRQAAPKDGASAPAALPCLSISGGSSLRPCLRAPPSPHPCCHTA